MDEILREEKGILEEFRQFGDPFSCYSYLLALAALLPPFPKERKIRENLVEGCQSSVWIDAWKEEGSVFRFAADSDTFVIRGLLYLLTNLLDGRSLEAVSETELSFWKDPLLTGSFDDRRQKGIGYVARTLRKRAAELMRETGGSDPLK